jgi:hypothetical protein
MKTGACVVGLLGILGFSGILQAQERVPPERRGFQLALRTGYSVPLGNTALGTKLSDTTGGQVPLIVDVGAKLIPELFLGGYFGFGIGGDAGDVQRLCNMNGGGCVSADVIAGIEAQYQILPGGSADPWLGYGVGIESIALSTGSNDNNSVTYTGWQFARLSGGVDFRLTRTFGIGPFADLSLGKYSSITQGPISATLANQEQHEWLTIGARFVFFP